MGKVFSIVEARATMVSINLERDWIEDPGYNAVDHVEKQDTDVIDMKQETLEDVYTGDMVASIEEIKEVNSEQLMPGAMYTNGDLYGENIDKDIWEVDVFDKSLAISSPFIDSDQILEANGEKVDQIYGEADLEDQISGEAIDDITFQSSKDDK